MLTRKCELRIEPRKLAIAEARGQSNCAAGFFGHLHAEVHGIGSSRRNQTDVHDGARGPGIALIDWIAVSIDLQRAIEVRSLFVWSFAFVLNHPAPENRLALVVDAFEF